MTRPAPSACAASLTPRPAREAIASSTPLTGRTGATGRLAALGLVLTGLVLAGLVPMALPTARAADDAPAAPRAAADPLATARGHIARERWADAIGALRRVNATGSADWNNLMGFSMRKQAPPDLDGAQRYYDVALRLDPNHRGALEYSGELALMKGDPETARRLLARLEQVCPSGCEERRDLEQALKRHAAGTPR